jgi:hypothetical protein
MYYDRPLSSEGDDPLEHIMRSPGQQHVDTPPVSPPRHQTPLYEDEVEEDYALDDVAMGAVDEYPFDRLLGDPLDDRHRGFWFFEPDVGPDEDDLDNGLYNADFGLPDGEDPPDGAALPRFQLALDGLDEEPELEPDNDPGDEGNDPEAFCAAFREHELIRNAYIDAFRKPCTGLLTEH